MAALPALALGDIACCATMRALAQRAWRSSRPRSLSAGLRRGDRVALVSRNAPAYVEALFACWWAGLVAVPVNASCMPRELAFVLADSGARVGVRRRALGRRRSRSARDGRRDLRARRRARRRASTSGCRRRPRQSALAAVASRRSRVALLHERHDRAPKGVVITHGNLLAMSAGFLATSSRRAGRRAAAPGAAVARLGPLSRAARRARRRQRRAGIGRLRRRRDLSRCSRPGIAPCFFAAPTMVQATGRRAGARQRAARSAQVHRLRRRSDVRRGRQGRRSRRSGRASRRSTGRANRR